MAVFNDSWMPLDNNPALSNRSDDSSMYAPHHHHSNFQDAEWMGFLRTLEHENPVNCSEFDLPDFDSTTQAGPGAMTTMAGLPLMSPASAPSSVGALITPPDSATHPGASWPGTSAPVMAFPPALMQLDIGNPWVDAQGFHTAQHFQPGQGLGIHIPHQLRNEQQPMRFDHVIKQDSPAHGRIISLKQSPAATWQRPYHREQSFGPTSDCNDHGDVDEEDAADPCYAQLLFRCLKEAPEHTLSLKDIYEWVSKSSNKAKDPKMRGWQNSVRHNLSMNAAFERVPANASQGSKKGSLWRLTPKALNEGVISTTRYRKDPKRRPDRRGHPAPKRQFSGARGGQATRAANRRNREMQNMRAAPYPLTFDRMRHHQNQQNVGFVKPHSPHRVMASPQGSAIYQPAINHSFSFFPVEHDGLLPQLPSNPLHMQPNTPPQVPLRYGVETKPALSDFELKHIDFNTAGLFGDHDTTDPETPSLGTEASFMTEDGMQGLLSHQTSRETTIF